MATVKGISLAFILIPIALGVGIYALLHGSSPSDPCPGGQVEYFTPQPDITAYQVARVVAANTLLGKHLVCVTADHPLPEEFVKHFSPIPVPDQNAKPDAKP